MMPKKGFFGPILRRILTSDHDADAEKGHFLCLAETMAKTNRQTHKHLAMDNQPLVANPLKRLLLILSKNLQICAPKIDVSSFGFSHPTADISSRNPLR